MKNRLFAAVVLTAAAPAAFAGTTTAELSNTATVVSQCSVATTQNLNFGAVNPLTTVNVWAQGRTQIRCTAGSYAVSINYGANPQTFPRENSSFACQRRMKTSTGLYTPYNLMTDDTQSQFNYVSHVPSSGSTCGNGLIKLGDITFNSATRVVSYAINAKMWTVSTTMAGSYEDSLTINVTF